MHGSREFTSWFEATTLDPNNFVVDFSSLGELKQWLTHMFDHTVLINEDDPERELFEEMHRREVVDLRILPSVSMEATASTCSTTPTDSSARSPEGAAGWRR